MDFIAGIDGGGTKTTILIGETNGNVIDKVKLGAFNINSIKEEGFKNLIDEVISVLNKYGRCLYLTIGAAGVSNSLMRSICEEKFANANIPFELVGDHIIALEGAHNGGPGLAVIAGTGSICFGKGENGLIERTGGWGHIIGDEGSAYALGRDIVKYVARDLDGYGKKTVLTTLLAEKFGLSSREEIIKYIYSGDKATIAAISPIVDIAYKQNDEVAISIIEENAKALALALSGVRKKLKLESAYVSFFGGLIDKDTPFRSALIKTINSIDSAICYRDNIHDAATGALMLSKKGAKND